MKYSRLLLSTVLFMSLMMSVAVAGSESSSKLFSTVKNQKQIIPTAGSDILGINKLKKTHMVSTFDRKVLLRSKPEPQKANYINPTSLWRLHYSGKFSLD